MYRALVVLVLAAAAVAACSDDSADEQGAPSSPDGSRSTITIALLDDAARRSVMYAIEQGIETSDTVDLAITYLPQSALDNATLAAQYDIVEASPLALVGPGAAELGLRLLSAGELDIDGTLLFTRAQSALTEPGELAGESIGVTSTTGVSTLATRYVLSEGYGLSIADGGGDVTLREAPSDSQATLLRTGEVAAAVPSAAATFAWTTNDEYRVLTHVAQEYTGLTDSPVVQSTLVVSGDLLAEQPSALLEVSRMLAAASAYESANRDQVIEAIAAGDTAVADQLGWWWQTHELRFGEITEDDLHTIGDVWAAAQDLGDIDSFPEPDSLALFINETH
jgi:hypothetical protein